jgi:hypothetical protein
MGVPIEAGWIQSKNFCQSKVLPHISEGREVPIHVTIVARPLRCCPITLTIVDYFFTIS